MRHSFGGVELSLKAFLFLAILLATRPVSAQSRDNKADSSPLSKAQQLASLSKSPDAARRFIEATRDENWYVRGQAARLLAAIDDKTAREALLPLAEDDNWFVREAALESLARLEADFDISTVQKNIQSPDPYLRARAVFLLGKIKSAASAETLIRLLADEHEFVRRSAASALGEMKAAQSVDSLIALLKDEDAGVKKSAAVALGRIGEAKAASFVAEADIAMGADSWEVAAALYRLGRHEHLSRITNALISQYRDARMGSFSTLAELADADALPAMLDATKRAPRDSKNAEEYFAFRLMLARSLSRFDTPQAFDALLLMFEDSDPVIRAAAVASLVNSPQTSARGNMSSQGLSSLITLLSKEASPVVVAALTEAISSYDRNKATDLLLAARGKDGRLIANAAKALRAIDVTAESLASKLGSADPIERARAVERLGRLGDTSAAATLINALADADPGVRVEAARSLGLLRERRAVEPLIAAAQSKDAMLKATAINALGQIGDPAAAESLFSAARDEDSGVRDAALDSLALLGISVERLRLDAASANPQARLAAVGTLSRLADRKAVPVIVALMKDTEWRVRAESARALGEFADKQAIDSLITALNDLSIEVRIQSALALGRIKDSRAVAALTSSMNDRDARVSLAAAESLARMQNQQSLRVLTSLLASQDFQSRARAAQVLARVSAEGLPDDVLSALASSIGDRDTVVRFYAAEALIASGAKAIPALMKIVASERESDRERATKLISRMGAAAVDPLIAFMRDRSRSPEARAAAAEALGILRDAKAIPSLTEMLRDENALVRSRAAEASGRMGEPAVDALLQMAISSPHEIRASAIDALGLTGSVRAIDRIIEALKDSSPIVRTAAVRALGESRSQRAVEPLMAIVRDESSAMRSQASAALAGMGDVALPGLIAALRDAHPSVRSLAAEALGEIGSREAVAALIELVKTDQSGARLEALDALGRIGDPAAVDVALSSLRNGSVALRKKAAGVLARFRDPRTREALIAGLTDANEEVREIAAGGLGETGEQKDLPLLERVADRDQSADVRNAAIKSIERIRARSSARKSGQ